MGNKKDIKKHIKTLQSEAHDIINDTAVPIEERIQRTTDIYLQAEKLAAEGSLEQKAYES